MQRFISLMIVSLTVLLLGLVLVPCASALEVDACGDPCCMETGETESCALPITGKRTSDQAVIPAVTCAAAPGVPPSAALGALCTPAESLLLQHPVPLRI